MNKKLYIVIPSLPEEQQKPFEEWLLGQSIPIPFFEKEGENFNKCAYLHDYNYWYSYWIKGEKVPGADKLSSPGENRPFSNLPVPEPGEGLVEFMIRSKTAILAESEKYNDWLEENYPPPQMKKNDKAHE